VVTSRGSVAPAGQHGDHDISATYLASLPEHAA